MPLRVGSNRVTRPSVSKGNKVILKGKNSSLESKGERNRKRYCWVQKCLCSVFSRHLLFALTLNKGRLGDTSSNLAGLSFKVPKGRELGRGERGGGGMRAEWEERDSGERTDPMHTALLWLKIFW